MEYRRLGSCGLQVSAVGLGTNNFGGRMNATQAARVVDQAIELGATFIDTSNSYSRGLSEEYIGGALQEKRDQVVIATKVTAPMGEGPYMQGASRRHILQEVEASLKRLSTDYIDVYQLHYADPNTPIEETLRTLDNLVQQGKVRYIGCSNYATWQVCELALTARMLRLEPVVSVQKEYNLLNREIETELVPLCAAHGLGILPYRPLASGFLTGKYQPGEPPPAGTRLALNRRNQEQLLTQRNFVVLSRLEKFVAERGHSMSELAIAWLLANPLVSSVIAGASSPNQVAENVKASCWHLTPEDMAELDKLITADK